MTTGTERQLIPVIPVSADSVPRETAAAEAGGPGALADARREAGSWSPSTRR